MCPAITLLAAIACRRPDGCLEPAGSFFGLLIDKARITKNERARTLSSPVAHWVRVIFSSVRASFGVAVMSGMAEAAIDFTRETLEEAGVELAYGAGAAGQSAVVEKFQRLEASFEAARLTILRAAWLSDKGEPNNMEASVCKAKGGSAVREITQGCIEILGPMGVSREHLLEKWFRDVRITDIYEGTGEIQRMIIARTLFDYTRADLS